MVLGSDDKDVGVSNYKTVDYSLDNDMEAYRSIKKKISENLLFNHNYYNDNFTKRRIEVRMRKLEISKFKDYADYLDKNPSEFVNLNKELTINVTQFYRDNDVYQFLHSVIIPKIIKRKIENNESFLTVCSIGCSTGEEPYSVGMIIDNLLADDNRIIPKIFALDYDNSVLTNAKIGEYSKMQMDNLPKEFIERYFDSVEGNNHKNFRIKDRIKDMVIFKQADILSNVPSIYNLIYDESEPAISNYLKRNNFDLILCRNLVIYFNREAKEIIYEKIYNSLNKDGYLVLGKTEVILGEMHNLLKVVDIQKRVYQKVQK